MDLPTDGERTMRRFRTTIIAFVTFIAGLYFFLEYVLPPEINGFKFGAYHEQILQGIQMVSIVTIGLGIINIFMVYGRTLIAGKKGWVNALALIGGFLLMMTFELGTLRSADRTLNIRAELDALTKFSEKLRSEAESGSVPPARFALLQNRLEELSSAESTITSGLPAEHPARGEFTTIANESVATARGISSALAAGADITGQLQALAIQLRSLTESGARAAAAAQAASFSQRASSFITQAVWIPLTAAVFSLLAFFMATAAYRAFRVRSFEAALIMFSALLVVLGQIPHGPIYISSHLPGIRLWLLENINTPAFRAIYIGSTVAGLAMAVRLWFSLERSPIDGGDRS